ncbi:MAG: DUF2232 domain-containing protein [Alphaproteobacteria bacterium]
MTFSLALAVFAGLVSAAMFAVMSTGHPLSPILVYFTALPLFALGLARGAVSVFFAVAVGALAIASIARIELAAAFVLAFALPTALLVQRALLSRPGGSGTVEWYPPGRLVLALAALALVIFGGGLAVVSFGEGDATATLAEMFGVSRLALDPRLAERISPETVAAVMVALPGIGAAAWMIMMTVNGTLAQAILKRQGWNARPGGGLAGLSIEPWFAVPGILGALLWWLGEGTPRLLGALIALVVAVVYLYQGLAVIHGVSWRLRWRTAALVGFYAALVLADQYVAPVIVLLGLAEPWLRLRERLAPAGGGGKEE